MATSVTRIAVSIQGSLRQILSIRDRGAEGAIIALKTSDYLDDAVAGDPDIHEQRMSFHPSRRSEIEGLVTLTHTIVTKTGQTADGRATVVLKSKNDCWVFFGTRVQDLTLDGYECRPKARDAVITLFETDNRLVCSPVYYLIAAHPDVEEEAISCLGYQYRIIRYDYLAIIIIFAFMGIPPLPGGSQQIRLTSLPRENKVKPFDIVGKSVPDHIADVGPKIRQIQGYIVAHTQKKLLELMQQHDDGGDTKFYRKACESACMLFNDLLPVPDVKS